MTSEQIVRVLLEDEEPFDARDYFTASTLEVAAKRLGMTALNASGCYYKVIGLWRIEVISPGQDSDRVRVYVDYGTVNRQQIVGTVVDNLHAADALAPVVDFVSRNVLGGRDGITFKDAQESISAFLKPYEV